MKGRPSAPGKESIEQSAVRYLARKDRTENQMRLFLQRRGASARQAHVVIRHLRELKYLDDEAYAQRWAEARIMHRPMGRPRLEAELLAQGFSPALVEHTLTEIYDRRSERVLAEGLLRVRKRTKGGPAGVRLLRSHGFSEDTIEEVLGKVQDT